MHILKYLKNELKCHNEMRIFQFKGILKKNAREFSLNC